MTNPYRVMCAELVDSVELLLEMRAVDAKPMAITEDRVSRARALLAQPLAPRQRPTHPTQNTTMTNPITPPHELVQQWCHEDGDEIKTSPRWFRSVCAKAARWGSDQELDACCEWLERNYNYPRADHPLRLARRPKPLSLKEQALELAGAAGIDGAYVTFGPEELTLIRRALEALDD